MSIIIKPKYGYTYEPYNGLTAYDRFCTYVHAVLNIDLHEHLKDKGNGLILIGKSRSHLSYEELSELSMYCVLETE